MGDAARLIAVAVLVLPCVAHAVCTPGADGFVVSETGSGLRVAGVVKGSPAARVGIERGDRVLQANGARPRTCGDWSAALEAAASADLDLLVLTDRGDRRRAAALSVSPPPPSRGAADEAAADEASAHEASEGGRSSDDAPARRAPSTRTVTMADAPTTTPPPRPTTTIAPPPAVPIGADARREAVAAIRDVGSQTRRRLPTYRSAVERMRSVIEPLFAQAPADPGVGTMHEIVRRHEGALIAWDDVELIRKRQGLRPSAPVSEGATIAFFSNEPAGRLIDEFPSLRAAVRRWEGSAPVTVSGLWEPMRARRILWAEADRLFDELVAAPAGD